MKCPACKSADLDVGDLDEDLPAHRCKSCEGAWVQAEPYWKWLEKHATKEPERSEGEPASQADKDAEAKLCPECGRIMRHHRIGRGLPFYIDRCSTCGGFWFDKGEWQILKARNLHDDVHLVFSDGWQQRVREEEQEEVESKRLLRLLGEQDYTEAQRIKTWIEAHPKRDIILAFVMHLDED